MKDWEAVENIVSRVLNLKRTKRSGASHGDGDLKDENFLVECKDTESLRIDEWWSKLYREAAQYERIPVLIVRRPPEKVGMSKHSSPQYLAVIDLMTLAEWKKQIYDRKEE